jgi:hypothetical protein
VTDEEELWGTDSGLVTDYEGVIADAFFQLNSESQFGDPQTQLRLKFATTDDKVVEERWNCGPDWVSNDGGETVTHPGGKKKFNQNAQAGKFVKAAMEAMLQELTIDDLKARGAPTTAKTWLGLRFFMEATTSSGKNRTTGEDWSSTKNYPTKFMGMGEETSGEVGVGTVALIPSDPLERLTGDNVAKVTLLAKTLPFGEWLDKVMEVEGVLGNDELVALLPDESGLYTTLREK